MRRLARLMTTVRKGLQARRRRLVYALAAPAGTALRFVLRAAPGLIGLALVSYGAWLTYRPAGFLVAGALILADVVASRPRARPGGDQ